VTEQNADVARQWAIIGDDVMEMMNDTGTPDVPKKP